MKRLIISLSRLVIVVAYCFSSNVFATLIGDTITATAVRDPGGSQEQFIFNGNTATVGAGVEFSAPNFLGGGSLFEIDVSDTGFTVFLDFADFSFLQPYSVSLSDLDWLGTPGQITNVTRDAVTAGAETWLDEISFGADFINLTSSGTGFIAAGDIFEASYSFTATHNGSAVPEPGMIALFSIGLLGIALSRRRRAA